MGVHAVGDAVEDERTLGDRGPTPSILGTMRRIQRGLHVLGLRPRDLPNRGAGDWRDIVEVAAMVALQKDATTT